MHAAGGFQTFLFDDKRSIRFSSELIFESVLISDTKMRPRPRITHPRCGSLPETKMPGPSIIQLTTVVPETETGPRPRIIQAAVWSFSEKKMVPRRELFKQPCGPPLKRRWGLAENYSSSRVVLPETKMVSRRELFKPPCGPPLKLRCFLARELFNPRRGTRLKRRFFVAEAFFNPTLWVPPPPSNQPVCTVHFT